MLKAILLGEIRVMRYCLKRFFLAASLCLQLRFALPSQLETLDDSAQPRRILLNVAAAFDGWELEDFQPVRHAFFRAFSSIHRGRLSHNSGNRLFLPYCNKKYICYFI